MQLLSIVNCFGATLSALADAFALLLLLLLLLLLVVANRIDITENQFH